MQQLREVYSLLMPLADGRAVVPRAAIAEVLGFLRPKDRPENAPEFMLGFIEWQGQRIPLVSLEAARGQGVPKLGRRTRIAVVFGFGGRLQPDVFALVTQGYPYLVRVNENVLQPEAVAADEPLILARVRMANEKPYIPDLEALEEHIVRALADTNVTAVPSTTPVDEIDALADVAGEEEDFDVELPVTEAEDADDVVVETAAEDDVAILTEDDIAAGLDESNDDRSEVELDVTGFGGETDYSAELDELASALDDTAAGVEIDLSALDEPGEGEEITLEGFELDVDDEGGEIDLSGLADDETEAEENDESEFDLSDLELLDDEDDRRD